MCPHFFQGVQKQFGREQFSGCAAKMGPAPASSWPGLRQWHAKGPGRNPLERSGVVRMAHCPSSWTILVARGKDPDLILGDENIGLSARSTNFGPLQLCYLDGIILPEIRILSRNHQKPSRKNSCFVLKLWLKIMDKESNPRG